MTNFEIVVGEENGVDCLELAQDTDKWRALLIAVIKTVIPQNAGNFLTRSATVCLSERTLPHG
jgi:hypothetical protein